MLALATLLRFAHLIALSGSPFDASLQLDHRAYDEWGQRIAAVVVLRGEATEDDLRDWCHEHLRGSKTPDHLELRAELPYTETGKLLRRRLRDELTASD